jgi:hypothetical protein
MRAGDNITPAGARTPGAEWLDHSNGGAPHLNRPGVERGNGVSALRCTKGRSKPSGATGMPGAGLTEARRGKALPEKPALKPYWGKPAVRNFRGGDGDVGIIRSPVRAIALPDPRGVRIHTTRIVG